MSFLGFWPLFLASLSISISRYWANCPNTFCLFSAAALGFRSIIWIARRPLSVFFARIKSIKPRYPSSRSLQTGTLLKEWSAFDDARVSSLSLAAANVNDDKDLEIIVASNSKGQAPEVKVFNQQGKLLNKFLAYHDSFRGGVNLATGDLDSTGRAQIVTIPASSGSAHVRIFTGTGKLVSQFMAEAPNLRGNFQVAVSDLYSSLKPEGLNSHSSM
jgi:hypothetical protein